MPSPIGWLAFGFALGALPGVALFAAPRSPGPGPWGGDSMILDVVADGADLEFECATGRITKAIHLDRRGHFDLAGTFSPEGHGPVRDGAKAANQVRYQGHVKGDTMTLTVIRGEERMGPYTLTRGRRPILKKCR